MGLATQLPEAASGVATTIILPLPSVLMAALAGYVGIAFLIVATDWILGFTIPELRTALEMPTYYFAAVLATDAIYSMAGGYLCAAIARTAARNAAIGLMVRDRSRLHCAAKG